MYDRHLESFCGSRQQRFEVRKGGSRVVSFCQVRRNSLADWLAEIEPQPDFATQQIDEQFRMNAANVMVAAALSVDRMRYSLWLT